MITIDDGSTIEVHQAYASPTPLAFPAMWAMMWANSVVGSGDYPGIVDALLSDENFEEIFGDLADEYQRMMTRTTSFVPTSMKSRTSMSRTVTMTAVTTPMKSSFVMMEMSSPEAGLTTDGRIAQTVKMKPVSKKNLFMSMFT